MSHARTTTDRRRPARPRGGFTLIEIVLALGVLLIGMTAVLGLLTTGAALTRTAHLRTQSASTVDAVVADLEETLFPLEDGVVGEPVDVVERPLPGVPGVVYSARATANPDDPREYRVDVDLAWRSGGVRRARSFSTLLMRELPFGERMRRRFVEGAVPPPPAPVDPAPGSAEAGADGGVSRPSAPDEEGTAGPPDEEPR